MSHCKVTWCDILWPKQRVFTSLEKASERHNSPSWKVTAMQSPPSVSCHSNNPPPISSLHFSNEPSDLCQVKSSMSQRMNQNLSSWLFPFRSINWYGLVLNINPRGSAMLLLTDCSSSRAIKAFVFHTIPPSHLLRRDDGGPFENNEAAWFIILIRRSETLAKPQLY